MILLIIYLLPNNKIKMNYLKYKDKFFEKLFRMIPNIIR